MEAGKQSEVEGRERAKKKLHAENQAKDPEALEEMTIFLGLVEGYTFTQGDGEPGSAAARADVSAGILKSSIENKEVIVGAVEKRTKLGVSKVTIDMSKEIGENDAATLEKLIGVQAGLEFQNSFGAIHKGA